MALRTGNKKQETAVKAATEKAQVANKVPEAKAVPKERKATSKAVKADPVETKTEPMKNSIVKKPEVKKPTAKKEVKVKAVVEYFGKQVEDKEMIAAVKKAWTKKGKKVGDIKTIDLYIKPEEGAVYFVINGTDTGAVSF